MCGDFMSLENFSIAYFDSNNYYDFPVLNSYNSPVTSIPNFLDFSSFRSSCHDSGVHFFIDDYKFNSIWHNPKRYINMFLKSSLFIMPDFSLYYDFPIALQIYNKFRNHWLASFYSVHGVSVVPNISVSTSHCWEWSFLGYPKNSVVAFSDIGCIKDVISRSITFSAYDEMIKRLSPIQVLFFTRSKKTAPSESTIIEVPYFKK